MSDNGAAYYQDILAAIKQLSDEYARLDKENIRLRRKISTLEGALEKKGTSQKDADSLFELDENKRMALKQQLSAYVERIDKLLQKQE